MLSTLSAHEDSRELCDEKVRDCVHDLRAALERADLDHEERERLIDRLCVCALPMARRVAARYRNRGVPLAELEQVAALALVGAARRFDAARGTDFVPYAVTSISGEIRKYFRDFTWATHVPRRLQENHLAVRNRTDTLATELGRRVGIDEVAASLGMSVEEAAEAERVGELYSCESLDATLPDGTDSRMQTLGASDSDLSRVEHRHQLRRLMATLDERQRTLLWLRYFHQLSQSEIADRVGLSQMHVSRLLRQALDQLRRQATESYAAAG
ncbi:sigma-70 family RNA polymerase sigma factor [Rhodococcus sp. SGAir0479]|uniref:sigma-70 family RNA polymerase sigma factor n=1 Tax=Rhodococcus sp. SGAir0479 TaxID=2567884 RepID=UPI0010CD2A97|nr:sigma-70 family RNA polymerase sigma factor [Rhodococcus sp. SGAir0479]QCQ91427.1 sigma-70 family RNA polymerase sigma factor [Rhodococcus sp. SGAir0479]